MATSTINQDQFFSQLIQQASSNPKGDGYLPKVITGLKDPRLDPFSIKTLDLGQQKFLGEEVDVTLDEVAIHGLANVEVAPGALTISGMMINFTASFSRISPPPKGTTKDLQISADFTLKSQQAGTLNGSATIAVEQSSLKGTLNLGGKDFQTINIDFSSLTVEATQHTIPGETSKQNVTATVQLKPDNQFFDSLIAKIMEQPNAVDTVVSHINTEIASHLTRINAEVTDMAQKILVQKLGP